ncbi:MAG: NUDIX hydrolase [Anaerolineae bacterium]
MTCAWIGQSRRSRPFEQGRVLLCHRRDIDAWNLPGGGVESGELPTEAVIREVREETGLEAAIERLAGVYGKTDRDELVFSFICRITGERLTVTDEFVLGPLCMAVPFGVAALFAQQQWPTWVGLGTGLLVSLGCTNGFGPLAVRTHGRIG